MSQFLKLLSICIFMLTSSQTFAGGAHLVMILDAKGDVVGCVAINKKFNELAKKLVPDNHPTVRIITRSSRVRSHRRALADRGI
jgi:hypothetical protein